MGRSPSCALVAIAVFLPLGCKATTAVESSPLLALVEHARSSAAADLARAGVVNRFFVIAEAGGALSDGGIDGGGSYGGCGSDLTRIALERMNGSMVADISFTAIDPGIRSDRVADTMILSCLERGGTTYEVRVPLGRRVDYFWSPR